MGIEILLYSDKSILDITSTIIDKVNLYMYYKEHPSKFEFKFINQKEIKFNEGDAISLKIEGKSIFFGYIFTISIEEDFIYSIKAYDQIRYLIARDTYLYSNKTATQIVTMICNDFNLKIGDIENTNYIIPYRVEENQTILDIIYTALDFTKNMTGNQYLFFDDFGKISLKNYNTMNTKIVLNLDTDVIDYKIQKSIDNDVYNSIKVTTKDNKTKIITQYQKDDSLSKAKWGTLRYFERLDSNFTKAQAEAYSQNILNLKNRNKFTITLDAIGNNSIRAGSVLTILKGTQKREMIVKSCIHSLANNEHFMKLILIDF